ncbi:hypothetical protein DFH08DRAFT_991669 [Mycena albidolilacea]|uniref:Uncharacterized protein n=1 Tax=Mycena albidolilacea TaxID=1033008 RepID=A0AAD7A9H5_9AGAR|nr:hypothetical protein DFH08DRAFT_991669 [Mycena albidolilacea]
MEGRGSARNGGGASAEGGAARGRAGHGALGAGQHVEDQGSARKRGARGSAREGAAVRGSARQKALRAGGVRRGRYRVEGRGGVPKARVACKVSEASAEDGAACAAGGGEWAEGGEPCGTAAQCAVTLGNAGKGGAASTEGGVARAKARAARGTRTGGANLTGAKAASVARILRDREPSKASKATLVYSGRRIRGGRGWRAGRTRSRGPVVWWKRD